MPSVSKYMPTSGKSLILRHASDVRNLIITVHNCSLKLSGHGMNSCEVESSEFLENMETSENIFPTFSTPSFPFCTIPKTEKSELLFWHFDQTLRCLIRLRGFHLRVIS